MPDNEERHAMARAQDDGTWDRPQNPPPLAVKPESFEAMLDRRLYGLEKRQAVQAVTLKTINAMAFLAGSVALVAVVAAVYAIYRTI